MEAKQPSNEQAKKCTRCSVIRTDNIDSNICGNCADDVRQEQEAWNGQSNSDTGAD